mmetsp:Transcript_39260/g.53351  ORF Transcript_39260/g.53351 Transcript_39260/m.53351 type:complete len:290 (-) Transcript_39260:13-882(-)
MPSTKQLFSVMCLAVLSEAQGWDQNPWKDVKYAIQVAAPGSQEPHHSYNFAKNADEEPKRSGSLTALGQRQMYLIGNELRHRFVEDADDFLSEDYLISQLHLQTAQDSASILSLQAQMYGLYPASEQNDLTEWQQGNAVPPIEGADFSKWQEELGAHALPHGINTFPIQMFGKDHDWLLSMNEKNCARWESEWGSLWAGKEKWYDAEFAKKFPEAMDHINAADGNVHDFCNYMEWAHLNGVELSIDQETAFDMRHFCQSYTHTRVTMKQGVDDKDSHIMSSMFLNDLKN